MQFHTKNYPLKVSKTPAAKLLRVINYLCPQPVTQLPRVLNAPQNRPNLILLDNDNIPSPTHQFLQINNSYNYKAPHIVSPDDYAHAYFYQTRNNQHSIANLKHSITQKKNDSI